MVECPDLCFCSLTEQQVLRQQDCELRSERGRPVAGHIFVLGKASAEDEKKQSGKVKCILHPGNFSMRCYDDCVLARLCTGSHGLGILVI